MSTHEHERLSAYLDAELPLEDRAVIEAHLADCAACRDALELLATVDERAATLPAAAPRAGYFDDFAQRVSARLAREPGQVPAVPSDPARTASGPRWLRHKPWLWALAAVLLLAVVTPLTMREVHAPGKPPARSESAQTQRPEPAPAVPAKATEKTLPAPSRAKGPSLADTAASSPSELRATPPVGRQNDGGAPLAQATVRREQARLSRNARDAESPRDAFAPGRSDRGVLANDPSRLEEAQAAAGRDLAGGVAGGVAGGIPEPVPPQATGRAATRAPATRPQAAAPAQADAETGGLAAGRGGRSSPQPLAAAPVTAPPPVAPAAPEPKAVFENKQEAGSDAPENARARSSAAEKGDIDRIRLTSETDIAAQADPAAEAFARLAEGRPHGLAAWRQQRDAWLEFASAWPASTLADEATLRALSAGVEVVRTGGGVADAELVRQLAAAYLGRPDAKQKARVRALLQQLPARP